MCSTGSTCFLDLQVQVDRVDEFLWVYRFLFRRNWKGMWWLAVIICTQTPPYSDLESGGSLYF
jgi:hypothetical protein